VVINHRWKAVIDWRNNIDGFDLFAVPAGKGKLEKMSLRTSSIYIAPVTVAPPLAISVGNRFIMNLW